MSRCQRCYSVLTSEGCLCSGSERRAALYSLDTDVRTCPWCGATRMSALESCRCGYDPGAVPADSQARVEAGPAESHTLTGYQAQVELWGKFRQ